MAELLLELYSEEIPAGMQRRAAKELGTMLMKRMNDAELGEPEVLTHVSPQRLVVIMQGLPEAQPDRTIEKKGPRVGAPEKAVQGFLTSLGDVDYTLEERAEKKGDVLYATYVRKGAATIDVLPGMIEEVLANFPWPKSMRWGDGQIRWVRPLRHILCLFAGKVVPVSFGSIPVSDETRGHRHMAPDGFRVSNAQSYVDGLRSARVILDTNEREEKIRNRARVLAEREGLVVAPDDRLFEELAGLVEYPVPLMGRIDERFMELPSEVLVTSMREHQKYLAVRDADGTLAPHFILVANIEATDGGRAIIAGNERVLRARLWDADFFWTQDRAHKLESRVSALDSMLFHAKLGTNGQRVERLVKLSGSLTAHIDGADRDTASRAALLAKADLTTGMVGEFPELQGIMGRYYARHDGESDDIAHAIADHYAPKGPGDTCPSKPASIAVALADKLDTLIGFFGVGEKPTGSRDPFALRRAALGIIRLILENGLRLPLKTVLKEAAQGYGKVLPGGSAQTALIDEVMAFVIDRLVVALRDKGERFDLIRAVMASGADDDLVRIVNRVQALADFLESESGPDMLAATRRAGNLVRAEEKKQNAQFRKAPAEKLFRDSQEQTLYRALRQAHGEIGFALTDEDYSTAMAALARLRTPLDEFFNHVHVMTDDTKVQQNRLCLLHQIASAPARIADFALIEDGGK